MALNSPFDVAFPVNFYSGGDTTTEAFGKHIQEIKRIYGIINAVNADKISADEYSDKFQKHIDDENPHPNLLLENTKGNLPFSRVTGDIAGSRITGELTRATISKDRINGLQKFVENLIPAAPPDKGDGVIAYQKARSGYVKFNNGLMIQWGSQPPSVAAVKFPIAFSESCFVVVGCMYMNDGNFSARWYGNDGDNMVWIHEWDKEKFCYLAHNEDSSDVPFSWIAIGV